jgi:hypothetical protein
MSLRRKSCNSCFQARRKCDLAYPVCDRCQKRKKKCFYISPPITSVSSIATRVQDSVVLCVPKLDAEQSRRSRYDHETLLQLDHSRTSDAIELRSPSIAKAPGLLGELTPVSGALGWNWLYEHIRSYPLEFVRNVETDFLHKSLYSNAFPRPLRAAFGICAACISLTEINRAALFQALDAEVLGLLTSNCTGTLLEDLTTLQAGLLYSIIRLFYGDIEQRIIAERQEYLLRSFALKLLQRSEAELRGTTENWETWILAESVRRTVFMVFKLYTLYAYFRTSICTEFAAMRLLPITTQPSSWNSQEAFLKNSNRDETMSYIDFASLWVEAPREKLEPFEKLALKSWKGCGHFEARINTLRTTE